MQVFIDDKQIDEGIIEGGTLGDALRHLQSALMTPQRVVAGVRCDGEPIAAEDLVASLKKPLTEFHRVDVVTSTKGALVIDVMTHAETSLEESESQSQRVAELLVEGRSTDAREALADCLHSWQQIHDAVAKSIGMLSLDPESVMIRDVPLIEAIGKPRDVLLQVKDADRKSVV